MFRKRKMPDREVVVVTLDQSGHSTEKRPLSTITREIMAPDRSILVNGQVCPTWDDVLKACTEVPAEEDLTLASIMKIQGG